MDGFPLELPIFLLATFAGALVAGLSGFAACVALCQPSASSATDPKNDPAAISPTIMTPVIATTNPRPAFVEGMLPA
jgi:hypothetical protein